MLLSTNPLKMLKKLSQIYRMSNEMFMAHVSSRLQEAVRDAGPIVVILLLQMYVMEKKETREKRLTDSHLEG